MDPEIGKVVTITTRYGGLPGTHRGEIVRRIGPWWEMKVFDPAVHHVEVCFSADQIVPDDTPTTVLPERFGGCEQPINAPETWLLHGDRDYD